jgi:sugar lactone lactonase YvrE
MRWIIPLGLAAALVGCDRAEQASTPDNNPAAVAGVTTPAAPDAATPADPIDARTAGEVRQPRTAGTPSPQLLPSPVQQAASAQRQTGMPTATGGVVSGLDRRLKEVISFTAPMPTVVAISREGRFFFSFPRWGDPVAYTVGEATGTRTDPFPDAQTNRFAPDNPQLTDPATHLVSVQSVVTDSLDRLWLLDTGSINMQPVLAGGPKLWGYDLASGERVKDIRFADDVVKPNTYLNDVRFRLDAQGNGHAFITDSGVGGIIVVDLGSGESWRTLDGHPSVLPTPNFVPMLEGQPMMRRPPGSEEEKPIDIASDGIAISPDGATIYYTALSSRDVWAVPADLLVDRNATAEQRASAVKKLASKPSANDGIVCGPDGSIYTTDFEDCAIRRINPHTGEVSLVVQDARLVWPDCVIVAGDHLYVTVNQLHRQPGFHRGKDLREAPYGLLAFPLSEIPGATDAAAAANPPPR